MDWLTAHDRGILYWFGSLHHPWLDKYARDLSTLGNTAVLATVSVALTLGFLLLRKPRYAVGFAALSVLSVGVNYGVKVLVNRPRPDVAWRLIDVPSNASFPSGHSLCTMAILTTAFTLLGHLAGRPALGLIGVLLGLAVGLTRPYLGVHYPTDVLAGWTAGLGLALVGTPLIVKFGTPRSSNPEVST